MQKCDRMGKKQEESADSACFWRAAAACVIPRNLILKDENKSSVQVSWLPPSLTMEKSFSM